MGIIDCILNKIPPFSTIRRLYRVIAFKDRLNGALMEIIKDIATRNEYERELLYDSEFEYIDDANIRNLIRPGIVSMCTRLRHLRYLKHTNEK